ncbi:MAG: hypothetical protein MSA09_03485 [Lachnospiraceae bacterium]|nr:hypothetical protein [Lachnospiraceae bacterium]
MAQIGEKTLEEIEEILDRGCEYADTQEVVHETFLATIDELGGVGDWDEMAAEDLEGNMCVLQEMFEMFYDKTIENVMNILRTQE